MNSKDYKETHEQNRREFLKEFGRYAALIPPVIYISMSAEISNANSPPKGSGSIKDQEFYDEILKTAHEIMTRST